MKRISLLCILLFCQLCIYAQYGGEDGDYNPQNPPNPDALYKLTLNCEPANAGTFNYSNGAAQLTAEQSVSVYAYANSGYVFMEWRRDGERVSGEQNYRFTMPSEDVCLVAVYEFKPVCPANPGVNYWNAETGEVIVDDFTPGSLSTSINNVIGGSSNRDKVQMMTIAGPINQNDWGVVKNYKNCTSLDLSRTYGMTYVPNNNFSGNTTLSSVSLPAGIEKIDYYAFRNCSSLSSIGVYAPTPPTIGMGAFEGIADSIVYVPADAISLYQNAEGWKDFTILPLENEVSNLEVNLPDDTDVSVYKDMFIELINAKSGHKQRYVVTNRLTYTFNNLIHRTTYNVYLTNARGDVLAEVDGIDVIDNNVSVTFPKLKVPRNLTLRAFTPEGKDITREITATWFDQKGTYLTQGAVLTGQIEGAKTRLRIQLSQVLAMQYQLPQDSLYTVQAENTIVVTLQVIPQTTIGGRVLDAKTGQPLSGVTLAVSQMLNGLYSKSFTTKTDNKGQWSLQVYEAKTDITASMDDYVSKTQSFEKLVAEIPDFELKDISGTTIAINLTYQPTGGELQEYYTDYANVAYTVYNATAGKNVTELNVQYPQIVLMEQLSAGTVLRVTATSKNQKFVPVSATATVDSLDRASVTLPIVQLGGINASFRQTDNPGVVGILYDGNGRLLKKYEYASATLIIDELQDGQYTLVTMASTQLFSTVGSLSQFAEAGLREGVDYVKNSVTVRSGEMAAIENPLIPFLDESKLYYTGDGTSITVNKSQITTGNYLTITGHIDFKSAYADQVSDVKLIVDLPEEFAFVDNSVMRGAQTATYTYADNQVVVPLDYYGERVRFCFIPTAGGEYTATGSVQFTRNGKTINQPIGNANFTVKDLSISVPSVVAKTTVPVSGTAAGKATVDIFDNGTLVGQTTARANGTWTTNIELEKPYNLSTHSIYAKLTTSNGLEMLTETKDVLYDMSCIEAKTVTMSFYNGWLKKNIEVVFDLQNKIISESSYMFYTTTDITFVADLTNNDTTIVNGVTIRVYTDKNIWRNLNATYDAKSDRWVAVSQFESSELPIGVEVELDANTELLADMKQYDDICDSFIELCTEYADLAAAINNAEDEQQIASIYAEYGINFFSTLEADTLNYRQTLENMSLEELSALVMYEDDTDFSYLDSIPQLEERFDALFTPDNVISGMLSDGTSIEYNDCSGLSPENLIELGFERTLTTEGYYVYSLITDFSSEFVCFEKNVYYKICYPVNTTSRFYAPKENSILTWNSRIHDAISHVEDAYNALLNLIGDFPKQLDNKLAQAEKDILAVTKKWQECHELEKALDKGIKNGDFSEAEKVLAEKQIKSLREAQGRYNTKIRAIQNSVKNIPRIIKSVQGLLTVFKRVLPITGYIEMAAKGYSNVQTFLSLYNSIPNCPQKPEIQQELQNMTVAGAGVVIGMLVTKLGVNSAIDFATAGQVLTAPMSGGTTLVSAFITTIVKIAADAFLDHVYESQKQRIISDINTAIANGKKRCNNDDKCPRCGKDPCECPDKCPRCGNRPCTCPKKCPRCGQKPCVCPPPYPQIPPIHDPSGYVYEGVASNRLQGVTATAYYKETVEDMYGDLHENVVLWDAEEYAQENPLFTDEYGMYRWDVPQGLWQVKFEKEGYQTTYSDWLPVPPPQLEVNIPMTQLLQPTVASAKAYSEGVEVTFDKYMNPETLTADNIIVTRNGEVADGTVELLNEEVAYEGQSQTFASKVRFTVPEDAPLLSTDEVILTVSKAVESYAGVQMQDTYTQAFDVEPRVTLIAVDSLINVAYGGERTLTVAALPADASKGKTMHVQSLSTMIATTDSDELTLDENGQAELKVSGELPGSTIISFTIDDADVTGSMTVNVKDAANLVTMAPRASRVSGTEVYRGTVIRLTSETEDAEIWYTLDGSCPCNTETALKYNPDEPIVIASDNVTIKAMAKGHDLGESEVAEFHYTLKRTTMGYQIPQGWTWLSHNIDDGVPASSFQTNALRILSQTDELINDPVFGLVGGLTELLPTESFKVQLSAEAENSVQGYEFNARDKKVPVDAGWNWIGYPVNQTMTLEEALAWYEATDGDYIVGQDGFAVYADGKWNGTLEGMVPGKGYLYKAVSDNYITYNTAIVSNAASRIGKKMLLMGSPWAVDRHAYPEVTPLIAWLYDNDIKTTEGDYVVAAFCDSECRGIGLWQNDRLMMNIYGKIGDKIHFLAFDTNTEKVYNITETFSFDSNPVGSWRIPQVLNIGHETVGINELYAGLTVTPRVAYDHVTVSLGGKSISHLTLTDMGGRTVVSMASPGKGATIATSQLPEGIYILTVAAGGRSYYQKIVKSNK